MESIYGIIDACNQKTLTIKEVKKMKAIKEIWEKQTPYIIRLGMLVLGLLGTLYMSPLTLTAHAQGHLNHSGWYHGMASLAENEIRAKEQTNTDNQIHVAITDTASDDEKSLLVSSEETTDKEKK
jgi:hypothetical protein